MCCCGSTVREGTEHFYFDYIFLQVEHVFFKSFSILCASVVGVLGMKTFGKPCFTQSRANERQILMVSPVTEPDYLRDLFTQVFFKHSTTFPVFLFHFFALFSNVLLFKFRLSIYLPKKQ